MKPIFIITILAVVMPAVTVPAFAADQIMVRYGDLELAQPKGWAQFDARIGRAVRRVCRADGRGLAKAAAAYACERQLMAEARAAASGLRTQMTNAPGGAAGQTDR